MLRVVYRAAPAGGSKRRPSGFSKSGCLSSFLASLERTEHAEVTFLVDGDVPDPAMRVMADVGDVVLAGGVGNRRSFLRAFALAGDGDPRRPAYLVEDDYLHEPDGLVTLVRALADAEPGTFLTLYDHPDRYSGRRDHRPPGPPVRYLGGQHWQKVESTTMTFAGHVGTFSRHMPAARLAAAPWFGYPHDRVFWYAAQGLGVYRPANPLRRRRARLSSSVPGMATHCEPAFLSPKVNWLPLSEDADRTARARGLDPSRW